MRITLLNGNSDSRNMNFDGYLESLEEVLRTSGHEVVNYTLRDMDIRYCDGCLGCWLKTPGECLKKDDMVWVRKSYVHSDLALFASPLKMGFITSTLKKSMDKLIPLVLPYFEIVRGEFHHAARYDHYPLMGVILEEEKDTDPEDFEINKNIFSRNAINLHTRLALFEFTNTPVGVVGNAINGL